jgi:hypothetical protein
VIASSRMPFSPTRVVAATGSCSSMLPSAAIA